MSICGVGPMRMSGGMEEISVPQWYAVHTRAKHEKKVTAALQEKGMDASCPPSARCIIGAIGER